jgi:hypothetical protein
MVTYTLPGKVQSFLAHYYTKDKFYSTAAGNTPSQCLLGNYGHYSLPLAGLYTLRFKYTTLSLFAGSQHKIMLLSEKLVLLLVQ